MKNFTFLITLFVLVISQTIFAQKVVVIGINHATPDGFSFVATETIFIGEIIYFTDNEYSDALNTFTFNGQPTGEAVVKFTVTSALSAGDVIYVNETSANTFTVTGSGGTGTAVISLFPNNGGFSLATNGDNIYAYSDTDENPVNGITQIYSVLYTGSGELPLQNGGTIPADANPVNDFPNAIVVDGFADDGDFNFGPDRVEYKFNPASLRDGVSKAALENPTNYLSYVTNQALSLVPFTNLNLSGANPVLTITASPASVSENSGSSITFTFSLSANAGSNITVNFSVGGTATFTTDYTQSGATSFSASSGTVTILSGSNTASLTISPVGDSNLEPNESVLLTLTAGTGYDAGSPSTATTIITNDDTAPVTPLVAITGNNQNDPEGFSFVALDDIAAGTSIYFTENAFDNTALAFVGSEAVLSWTAPGAGILRGEVIVIKENPANTFTATCNSGICGTISLISGTFSLASTGEGIFAYSDTDSDPLNGVTEVYSVLFTGTTTVSGGNIPTVEDPSAVYIGAVVVDGFAALSPDRTEYNPGLRGVTVDQANFQNTNNWLHAQTNQDLSTIPFNNIIIATGSANPTATLAVSPSSVTEDSGTGLVYTFSLSAPASGNITVNFSVGGTATFNTDYTVSGAASFTASTGSVTILDGSSSAAVTIMPTVDSDVEVQETVALIISSGTGYDGGSPNDATGIINNDDTSLSDPLVAITGINHITNDGFSFVAAKDIPAGTKIYFTENSFNNTTLMFGSGESLLLWTSPGSVIPAGQVIVVTEIGTDAFSLTRSGGSVDVGGITVITGGFAVATDGETLYAYEDDDNDPTNGVVDIYSVLFSGAAGSPGGSIPPTEDPSGIYLSALVVDGFPATQPDRTEYDPTKRNILVEAADFENTDNWLHAEANQVLSTVPFDDIQIIDLIPPVAVCKDITVELFGSTVNIAGVDVDNGSSDNIGVASYTLDISSFTCANVGTPVTVTLTVSDAAGNTDNCTATVTVLDKKAPSPICINGLSFNLDASGNFTLFPSDLLASPISDNCSAVTLSLSKSDYTCADVGTNIVQLHATDDSGNSDYCETYVIVNDVTPPTAVCQNIDVYLNAAGTATIVAADLDGGSADNCDAVTLSTSATTFTCADLGPNNVTLTVTDQSTNSANCIAVVTVIDSISPTAVCQNINVYLDGAGNASIVPFDIDGGSADNCGAVTLSASATTFTCADLGPNNVTLTVTDQSTNSSNCVAVVNVIDTISPVITCPGNQIEIADVNCEFTLPDYTGLAAASENCGLAVVTQSPSAGTVISGTTTIILTANDGNGNSSDCNFEVSLIDVIPPTAVCQNIDVYLDGAGTATIVAANIDGGSTDNCGAVILIASTTTFSCADIGPNNVTLTVTDQSTNMAFCLAVVTVIDTISPVITCPGNQIENAGANCEFALPDYTGLATATDNCGAVNVTQSPAAGTVISAGTTVTLTADDGNGNSADCSFDVTLIDATPPTAVCQNITISLDAAGVATIVAADIDGGSTDNCSLTLSASKTIFSCGDIGPNNVTLTATDGDNNSDNCIAVVTVIDAISPVAVCKDITVQLDPAGNASILATDIDGGSTDNCSIASLSASQTAFTIADVGDNVVVLTVIDGSGNMSTCNAIVKVVLENIPPVIVCNSIDIYLDENGAYVLNANDRAELAKGTTDNVDTFDDLTIITSPESVNCKDVGTQTKINVYVHDRAGNWSACQTSVNILDTFQLEVVPISDIEVQLESGACETKITYPELTTSNACATFTQVEGLGKDGIFPAGTTLEKWLLTNTGNDTLEVSFTVTVIPVNELPTIDTISDIKINQDSAFLHVPLAGISYGVDCQAQDLKVTASGINPALISEIEVNYLSPDSAGTLSLTLVPEMSGIDTIMVKVVDSEGDSTLVSFAVVVNASPTINPIADIEVDQNTPVATVMLSGISSGSKDENQAITVTATNTNTSLVSNVNVNYNSPDSIGSIELNIEPMMLGTDSITVTVFDGETSVSETFEVSVVHTNNAPVVVYPIDDQVVHASYVLKIPVNSEDYPVFEDADGDTLTYSLLVDGKPELPAWMTVENDTLIVAPAIADTGCVTIIVMAMDPSNAMAADTFQLCVDGYPTGSIDVDATAFDIKMYPNPTKGVVNLKINASEIMDSEVIVRSITGSEVFRKEYKASELIRLDLSNNVSGIYLVTLKTEGQSIVKKLILDRK